MTALRAITMQKKGIERVKSLLYSTCPVDGNMFHWEAVLFGPAGSPYENGVFKIGMHFPPEYPFKPPKILIKLHEMLTNPEIGEGDYYDEDKAKLYKEDKAGFDETARECTLEHAGA
ncbi:ubiquitin-conjugating enzyme E2 5B-like [Eutrema salsugineum]|uniref:ubiquitin-conjugating enzyme E2 5B-like n=1 Tax=Eutrema salsugineum TaxID=72664 RepID=UPI000CED4990|nr:ubiquitin-conjugating enzyme E2 5B-like [Eutrema salsugineum]